MALQHEIESLGAGYYWVGSRDLTGNLQCNPYLLVEGDEAVLFDPGSVLDVETVVANVASIVPLDKVKYVVLPHQDPDLASAVPRLEALGMRFTIVTHWRTWSLVRFYGVKSPAYMLDEHGYALALATGRVLQFIPTPYLHFPGAVATYDKKAKFLLSSDLFGAFQPSWSLYADETYMEGMKAFHEHYMPSHDILKPVMEIFSCLELGAILPQHGSIITKNIPEHIEALRTLACGTMLGPVVERQVPEGEYRRPAEKTLFRVASLFGKDLAEAIGEKLGIEFDPATGAIASSPMADSLLWDRLFDAVYLMRGQPALSVLEPFVANLCAEFSLSRPKIYLSTLQQAERTYSSLGEEVAKLREMNELLRQTTSQVDDSTLRDPVTGLYNENYYRNFIDEQASIALGQEGLEDDVLAVVGIDEGMARIEYQYGPREVEAILKGVARILLENVAAGRHAFRMHGTTFAFWMPRVLFHEANELCETMRDTVASSKSFIEPITISVGLVAVAELGSMEIDPADAGSTLSDIGIRRLRLARKRGGNLICSTSETGKEVETKGKVLIVDDDTVNAGVVKTFLENADYAAATAKDGAEALSKIGEAGYDLIISELMIPKIDGFMLKEALARKSGTKDIPFILLSHRKDEKSVTRAYRLGINYYLQKPYLLAELLGIVQNLTAAGAD
ncbi:response regulator [bacterium]|nr:response regulator [bacterium]